MFYEVVVGVLGKCQRVEHQGVDRGRLEQAKMGCHGAETGKVKVDKVVTQDEGLALCQFIKTRQRLIQGTVLVVEEDALARAGRYRGEGVDELVVTAHFQVQ